jgi:hypothetical protein
MFMWHAEVVGASSMLVFLPVGSTGGITGITVPLPADLGVCVTRGTLLYVEGELCTHDVKNRGGGHLIRASHLPGCCTMESAASVTHSSGVVKQICMYF